MTTRKIKGTDDMRQIVYYTSQTTSFCPLLPSSSSSLPYPSYTPVHTRIHSHNTQTLTSKQTTAQTTYNYPGIPGKGGRKEERSERRRKVLVVAPISIACIKKPLCLTYDVMFLAFTLICCGAVGRQTGKTYPLLICEVKEPRLDKLL
jgi:hypothetical protein